MHALSARRRVLTVTFAVLAAVLATLVAGLAVLGVQIEGASMRPTLEDGDRVLMRPFSGGDTPDRFDLVVGRFDAQGPAVVKRVIAVPGDRIRIDAGAPPRVEVQPGAAGPWSLVDNPAWAGRWGDRPRPCCADTGRASFEPQPAIVPAGSVFLLGDNPAASQDSRAWGWAPIALIDGIVGWRLRAWVLPADVANDVTLRPVPG